MSEREIADLKRQLNKYKDYTKYLKEKIKERDHTIRELSLLLNSKIKFRNEVKKCQKQ